MRNAGWNVRPDLPLREAPANDWGVRPRYSATDFATLLWRERFMMLAVFAVLLAAGVFLALQLPKSYEARSSLLVMLGQEYVYEPEVGDAGRGAVPGNDQVIQSEIEILSADHLKERVVRALGPDRLYPKAAAAAKANRTPAAERQALGQGVRAIDASLKVSAAPQTSVIRLTYQHKNPEMAAAVLNRLVDEYLSYRKQVLLNTTSPLLAEQRRAFEQRLATADASYGDFLADHRIGDFDSEKTSLSNLHSSLTDESLRVSARLQEVRGRVDTISAQLARVQPEVGLYRDENSTSADKLLELRIEREDLLSRYRPEARPVQEIDARITQLERMIAEGRGTGQGARRYGVNPMWQTLQTENVQLQAEAVSLQRRGAEIARQLEEIAGARLRLNQLEPTYQDLQRERGVLSDSLRDMLRREQESRAAQEIASKANDNIRVVERALVPTQGKSLKKPALVLAFLFAAFTALSLGFARIFVRRGFLTPNSAARTLDLPVLATAPMKAA